MARVLFVCTGNTCRSPMAERLARRAYPQHRWESAGVRPTGGMHPLSQHVVRERGGDAEGFDGRNVADLDLAAYDHVVLIGEYAQRLCPPLPPTTARHSWDVPDPYDAEGTEEERLEVYRNTAEALQRAIDALALKLK
jgi:arsenate reductase (thioredoxin)